MEQITFTEFFEKKDEYCDILKKGGVFIYPTDTIYGIGCDATNSEAVKKVREIKQRASNPFSVIAPSKDWIYENCEVSDEGRLWIEEKLPGPYTLIIKIKNKEAVVPETNDNKDTLGVRIPDHPISMFVAECNKPLITTSVNFEGKPFMTSLDDCEDSIREAVDFIVYEGLVKGRPSTLVFFEENGVREQKRG